MMDLWQLRIGSLSHAWDDPALAVLVEEHSIYDSLPQDGTSSEPYLSERIFYRMRKKYIMRRFPFGLGRHGDGLTEEQQQFEGSGTAKLTDDRLDMLGSALGPKSRASFRGSKAMYFVGAGRRYATYPAISPRTAFETRRHSWNELQ